MERATFNITYVINSHRHADHVFGNQVLRDARILVTEKTRELMETRNSAFLEQVRAGPESPHQLAERLKQEHDAQRRKEQKRYLGDIQALSSVLEQLRAKTPRCDV